jgi:Ca2+:H+ antiporter
MRVAQEQLTFLKGSWLNALLIFIPISLAMHAMHGPAAWVFIATALAIVPLAGLIGQATEAAAEHTGPGIGGLLNATFGNATELIIALFALQKGLLSVVKASISGSILGNLLLVLGLSMLSGGIGRDKQTFNRTAAGASVSMLMLAMTALIMPALWDLVVFHSLTQSHPRVQALSLAASGVLLAIYVSSLVFSLITHRELLSVCGDDDPGPPKCSLPGAVVMLVIATILTAVQSEVLVGVIDKAAEGMGLTQLFIGVVVVAVVGNAAEHYTAVVVARRGNMELAFSIALGSSTQIALLVAPVLVFASLLFGHPMDLVFGPFELVALGLAVLNVAIVSMDGESNWFEGLQLLGVYLILAIAFYFLPALHILGSGTH